MTERNKWISKWVRKRSQKTDHFFFLLVSFLICCSKSLKFLLFQLIVSIVTLSLFQWFWVSSLFKFGSIRFFLHVVHVRPRSRVMHTFIYAMYYNISVCILRNSSVIQHLMLEMYIFRIVTNHRKLHTYLVFDGSAFRTYTIFLSTSLPFF